MTGFQRLAAVFAVCIGSALAAQGDLVQFEIRGGQVGRLITLESELKDQVAYVPLESLIEQAGGSYNVLPTRIRVDLGGTTAWLRGGEARVNALSIFSLTQPVIEDPTGAFIAVADVPDFFLKSFRLALSPVGGQPAATTTMPPPTDASAPTQITPPPAQQPGEPSAVEQPNNTGTVIGTITSVVIDPGHGGYDTGLASADSRAEDAVTLAVATKLKAALSDGKSPTPVLTRTENAEVSAAQRSRFVQGASGVVFISIHTSSALGSAPEGIAVYYSAPEMPTGGRTDTRLTAENRRLAESVGAAAAAATGATLRGVMQVPLRMLSDFRVPAIEIEVGCLSSTTDAQRLASDEYLAKLANGIRDGINAYVSPAPASQGVN